MNFEEKYNSIINTIEDNIYFKTSEIVKLITGALFVSERTLGESFQFITGKSLHQYIRERRLICAVQFMIDNCKTQEEIAEEFGYNDGAHFSKSFKAVYEISPSQVQLEDLLNYPPLTFDKLSCKENQIKMIKTVDKKTAFGTTKNQFLAIKEVLSKAVIYGLTDSEAEKAYYISKKVPCTIDEACSFMIDYKDEYGSLWMRRVNKKIQLDKVAKISITQKIPFYESFVIWQELIELGIKNIDELPESFWHVYIVDGVRDESINSELVIKFLDKLKENDIDDIDNDEIDKVIRYCYDKSIHFGSDDFFLGIEEYLFWEEYADRIDSYDFD